jgi:hypothetical protein
MAMLPVAGAGETVVPNLIGLDVQDARGKGHAAGLVVVGPAPDGTPPFCPAGTWSPHPHPRPRPRGSGQTTGGSRHRPGSRPVGTVRSGGYT